MPGSSLWLLPPAGHPLDSILASLVEKTANHFNSTHLFIPHITLTSDISPATYSPNAQEWLDSLPFPAGQNVHVKLGALSSENVFVRKLYSTVAKGDGIRDIGAIARRGVQGFEDKDTADKWAEEKYEPHLSLLYHDCPKVSAAEIAKIETLVSEAGVNLRGEGDLGGWVGGRVVLVPTDRPVKEWAPIAERRL